MAIMVTMDGDEEIAASERGIDRDGSAAAPARQKDVEASGKAEAMNSGVHHDRTASSPQDTLRDLQVVKWLAAITDRCTCSCHTRQ